MSIEYFAWCSSQELFIQGITTTALPDGTMIATIGEDGTLIPHEGVVIDQIGPITKVPAVIDPDTGDVITPAVVVEGWHVNLLAYGQVADLLIMGPPVEGPDGIMIPTQLPQYDEDGNLLPLFERTNILQLIPDLVWTPIPGPGVPGGYEGPNGVCLYDPAVVDHPARVFL
jgi:hypothetical protein